MRIYTLMSFNSHMHSRRGRMGTIEKIQKIKLPDNLIASTAMVNGLIIVTRNVKDFKSFDVEVLNIFEG